jgi:hypothetical protein
MIQTALYTGLQCPHVVIRNEEDLPQVNFQSYSFKVLTVSINGIMTNYFQVRNLRDRCYA